MPPNANGIECDAKVESLDSDAACAFPLNKGPWLLTQVFLQDQSDAHAEFLWERQILLHPSEKRLDLRGNLFSIESRLNAEGTLFINEAPLPHARPELTFDLCVAPDANGFKIELAKEGNWSVVNYSGGEFGRLAALQNWQRSKLVSPRSPKFLCNTWGDRSRDSRIQEDFILREIEAAKHLGAEVVQIDDGWQKGRSSNSAEALKKGGVWEGFWNADPNFWTPDPVRFPHGLEPLQDAAKKAGLEIGLWFAPDSWNEFANWEKDARFLLDLHKRIGIKHFKLDGINAQTPLAMERVCQLVDAIVNGSNGAIIPDMDITAQLRPSYLGALNAGPLFLENRYTDWRTYWPHHTLRALWTLARWIDPQRLRMEFLNVQRNKKLYEGSPLAPAEYPPATLFASVMFANPLGWFEISNLPESYFKEVAPLVKVWRKMREELAVSTILPVGAAPDGMVWTGFLALAQDRKSGYALFLRELNEKPDALFPVPGVEGEIGAVEILAGEGSITSADKVLKASVHNKLGFVLGKFSVK